MVSNTGDAHFRTWTADDGSTCTDWGQGHLLCFRHSASHLSFMLGAFSSVVVHFRHPLIVPHVRSASHASIKFDFLFCTFASQLGLGCCFRPSFVRAKCKVIHVIIIDRHHAHHITHHSTYLGTCTLYWKYSNPLRCAAFIPQCVIATPDVQSLTLGAHPLSRKSLIHTLDQSVL